MISTILLTIVRDKGFGLNALSYLSQLALVITGFALVDDTDIINAAPLVNTTGEDFKKNNNMSRYVGRYIMSNRRNFATR